MKDLLTVVIPTWNNLEMLKACLESLFQNTQYPLKVIVIDNGCKGEVKNSLSGASESLVEVLEPKENLGWMRAHQLALDSCDTPYYCMLNDDVVFIPGHIDFWRKLTSHLQGDIAAVGPGSNFVAGSQNVLRVNIPPICDSSLLIGFCMVLKTDIFKEIGGPDSDLPGGDDLDISIRLRKAGYGLRIDRTAYLHHIGQQTGTRIHGADWDSDWSQEVTNNALMAKHGASDWHDCILAFWSYPKEWELESHMPSEDTWYSEHLASFNGSPGLNIGCGGKKIEGSVGVDIRSLGEKGVGGELYKEAVTDIQSDAHSIALDDNSQHYIVAAHILEHLINPIKALKEWKRLLISGGKLLITVPDYDTENTMLIDYTHLHAYTEESLKNIIELSGFYISHCERNKFPYQGIRIIAVNEKEEVLV